MRRPRLEALARGSARRPWTTVAVWSLMVIVAGGLTSSLFSKALTTRGNFTNAPEAVRAGRLLDARFHRPQDETELVIVRGGGTVDQPSFHDYVARLERDLAALGPRTVRRVASFYETRDPSLVSADRHAALIAVVLAKKDDSQVAKRLLAVTVGAPRPAGFRVWAFGEAVMERDFQALSSHDLARGEKLGLPIALVVLVLVFGAALVAGVPIGLALFAIVVALGATSLLGLRFHFAFFVFNMIVMMGLAVGIDYSLFIVSRYREERARGLELEEAIAAASRTAGRAVTFSGMTVVLALAGLLILPMTIYRSLGAGAILVVLASMAATMTLLPAVLRLMGDRVESLKLPLLRHRVGAEGGGWWDRMARAVMGRPVVWLVASAGVLMLCGSFSFGLNRGFSGVSATPESLQVRRAFDELRRDFAGGLTEPVEIAIDGPVTSAPVQRGIASLRADLSADRAFDRVLDARLDQAGRTALVAAVLRGDPRSEEATRAIRRIRDRYVPASFAGSGARVLVGGNPVFSVDFYDMTHTYTPLVFLFVLSLSFLLLMLAFRSIVVPLKAVAINLLSVGAAYGLLVVVFQQGHGAGLFGFTRVDTIEAWLPLFLFSILFGLSMDYHVFLLSRIKEHYDETGDNTDAVAFGLRSTGRIITGAALIMVVVFGALAAGDLTMLQQSGFGLAVAVLLDATIVRTVLVPSSMRLLGRWNWYLPAWLAWLPHVHIEGERPVAEEPETAAAAAARGGLIPEAQLLLLERTERMGWTVAQAAEALGVSPRTAGHWLRVLRHDGTGLAQLRGPGELVHVRAWRPDASPDVVLVAVDDATRLAAAAIVRDRDPDDAARGLGAVLGSLEREGVAVRRVEIDRAHLPLSSPPFRGALKALGRPAELVGPERRRSAGVAGWFLEILASEWDAPRRLDPPQSRPYALEEWVDFYNRRRPSEALGGRTPVSALSNVNGGTAVREASSAGPRRY